MALKDDLIAAWELDEASGNAIDSHGTNDLTEGSGTIGSASGGRDFEAADTEYLEIADNADVSVGDIDFTFEFWMIAETLTGFPVPLSKDNVGSDREYGFYYSDGSAMHFYVSGDGTSITDLAASNFGAMSASVTYQVIGWHDSVNNQIGICINDGTPNTTAHTTGVANSGNAFRLGATNGAAGAGTLFYDGVLKRCRLWKRMLTSDERTELYNGGSGLAYADFDAGGGFVAFPRPRGLYAGMSVMSGGM